MIGVLRRAFTDLINPRFLAVTIGVVLLITLVICGWPVTFWALLGWVLLFRFGFSFAEHFWWYLHGSDE